MRSDLSLVAFVLDASGSMCGREGDVIGSVKSAIKEHSEAAGDTIISVYQFATTIKKSIALKNAREINDFKYTCSGGTALYDAIGTVINEIGSYLSSLNEEDRPGTVEIMIITDGRENSSKEYSVSTIKKMVEHQTSKYSWLFTYLGSNQDAILAGSKFGINADFCATYSDANFVDTMSIVNSKLVRSKGLSRSAMNSVMAYSADERELLVKDDNR